MTKTKAEELDQYYTNPKLAEYFMDKVKTLLPYDSYDIVLEPSAGTGSFFSLFDARGVGLDLDPKCAGVVQQNFYDYHPLTVPASKVLTVGNPPFGKNSSEAIKFFNHAAGFSDAIAFVIPRTFRKTSVQNRLNLGFELIFDETVPDNSFIFNDNEYDVWCCMQIWTKTNTRRTKVKPKSFSDVKKYFQIVEPSESDFAIQRVGAAAGRIRIEDRHDYSPASHWFIKSLEMGVLDVFSNISYDDVKYNTAGNPSISPGELVEKFLTERENMKKI